MEKALKLNPKKRRRRRLRAVGGSESQAMGDSFHGKSETNATSGKEMRLKIEVFHVLYHKL